MKANKIRRLTACVLLGALLLPQTAFAAAPETETDEAVYVNLDYYGQPETTRIVKGVSLNGHTEFTDYGDYTNVYNMSTYDEPVLGDGSVDWSLADNDLQRFYYECIPNGAEPLQMPWNFDVSYKLNGVPVEAEKCAGASGLVEITIHAVPNSLASEYYKNNMMLICATGIDMSKELSIEAPGAQIQSMGSYKFVVFMGLPGEENTFTARIGSNCFESMGLIMFMAPATLSSLDILSDMRSIKDRIGDSGDSLYEGLSDMLSTMQSMKNGLNVLSGGIAGINDVRRQLIADRGTIDPATDAALDALEELAGKSDSLIPELESTKTTLTTLNATVNSMLGTLTDSSEDVTEYQKLLRDLKTSLGNLDDLLDDLSDETSADWLYLSELRRAFSDLSNDSGNLSSAISRLRAALGALSGFAPALIENTLDQLVSAGIISEEQRDAILEQLDDLQGHTGILAGELDKILKHLESVADNLQDLLSTTESIISNLEDINDVLDDYDGLAQDFTSEGQQFAKLADQTLERVNKLLADIPSLSESLDSLTTDATSAADKSKELMTSLANSLTSASGLLNAVQQSLRSVRDKSDASLQASLDGLLDVLQKATASNSSGSMQNATDSIHQALDDAEKDLEEDTNMLNLDSSAELQSVTSERNPSPASLQFILRTREISADDSEEDDFTAAAAEDEGVLARIGNIFKKLFSAIYSVFASEE
ncbi:MAG: hypothetical protein ACOYIE_08690 [Agathobaculum sp.]|uniref:hypothetical protein n=1 Tax=Agathobaculum sp. TaxID=2048138 RepID=UPI003D92D631